MSIGLGLDVSGRTKTMTRSGVTSTYKYAGDGDSADWVVDGSTTTRYVGGAGGLSAVQVIGGATTWILPAPHGEVWAHTDSTGAVTATFGYDEYGVARQAPSGTVGLDRYGWLGKQQRETDTTTGLILMGVRVYDPGLGRFLSVDPVHGGSANSYDFAEGDPINSCDVGGTRSCKKIAEDLAKAMADMYRRIRQLREAWYSFGTAQQKYVEQLRGRQRNLEKLLIEWGKSGCGPPPPGAWSLRFNRGLSAKALAAIAGGGSAAWAGYAAGSASLGGGGGARVQFIR